MSDAIHAQKPVKTRERALLICGAIAPLLFIVVFVVAGAVRPGFSPVRHAVSALSLGESGWIQVANFIVTGALILAFAFGLRPALRRYGAGIWPPLLIGLVGAGLIASGVFPMDPFAGYPPGTPAVSDGTTEGALHDAFGGLLFQGLAVAMLVVAYRFARSGHRRWAAYSVANAVVFVTGIMLFGMAYEQNPTLMPIFGLLQRLTIITGWTWLAALAVHLLRHDLTAEAGGADAQS